MKYLIILILIGIALYFVMKWKSPFNKGADPADKNDRHGSGGSGSFDSDPYPSGGSMSKKRKSSYAKWIGGGLGWAFGGPIGGILGFMFGSMFDGMNSGQYEYGQTQTGDFNISLLVLTAAVMKADGRVKRSELDYVKHFFNQQFGVQQSTKYIKLLREVLKQDLNIQEVSLQIGKFMDYSSRLLLVQYLFGLALADGNPDPSEISLIQTISGYLGIGNRDYESIKAMFVKDTDSAYKILEVSPTATDDEIKKSYRELAKKYHPDKVSYLGEDVKKAAEEKFTKLNAAYEAIKQERGMK